MRYLITIITLAAAAILTGCSTAKAVTESASGKNLDLSGYVMLGEVETANPENATPQGKLIIGRVTYKSRKVGIPADQKVPNAGNFRATRSRSLFGAEETIIEYDWTAGSDADAAKAEARLKTMKEETEQALSAEANASSAESAEESPSAASEK